MDSHDKDALRHMITEFAQLIRLHERLEMLGIGSVDQLVDRMDALESDIESCISKDDS